jgi:hypothetical protein
MDNEIESFLTRFNKDTEHLNNIIKMREAMLTNITLLTLVDDFENISAAKRLIQKVLTNMQHTQLLIAQNSANFQIPNFKPTDLKLVE